jgi:CubicO group peptidase (beta-lactamase class C family)
MKELIYSMCLNIPVKFCGVTAMFTNADNELPRTSPEQQGIASSAILQFVEVLERQMHEVHSFMLLRHGSVVAEGWWAPHRREYPHMLFSVSKSFTATAVGLAMNERYFAIDAPVLSFFPNEAPAEVSDYLAAMRVRDLLTMTTGHAVDTWGHMIARSDGDWLKGFLEVPVRYAPGTHFLYNTGATYLLSAIVQKTTGMNLVDYLEPRLFGPLGIRNATWEESPQGISRGGIGLSIRTEDIARFGQLYLQNGMWRDRQLLPEGWAEAATSAQVSNGDTAAESDATQGYGYQFWRCRHGAYRGSGLFGQYCIVMPEQDAVLAFTSGIEVFDSDQLLTLTWERLLPAMQDDPLPDDAEARNALMSKLSNLMLPPVQGQAESPVLPRISGRTYQVDGNELGIETVMLDFAGAGWTVSIKIAGGEETIPCGYGVWQRGHTTLFNGRLTSASTPVATSGAWTAEDRFTMVVRLYETPFYHTLVYHFVEDEMLFEARVNITLGSPQPLLMIAHTA